MIVCCETFKFCDRVQLDSICMNELGDPDALVTGAPVHKRGVLAGACCVCFGGGGGGVAGRRAFNMRFEPLLQNRCPVAVTITA